jgi:hypothetical protein
MHSDRVKNLFLFAVLLGWGVTVGATVIQGKIPDAPLLGIPGAVWLALHPPRIGRGGAEEPGSGADPPPPAAPAQEGGGTT